MQIRHITHDDINALAKAHYKAFTAMFDKELDQKREELLSEDDFLSRWEARLDHLQGSMFVAEDRSGLLGFVVFGAKQDKNSLPEEGEITMLHDFKQPKGGEAAKALMETALGHLSFSGYDRVYAWLPKENKAYRKFFESYGFSADHRERIEKQEGLIFTSCHYGKRLHDIAEDAA